MTQALWQDIHLVELQARVVQEETRTMFIGKIADNYWSAITHQRGKNTRIISVRRARTEEIRYYESRRT